MPEKVKLYNTLSRSVEVLETLSPGKAGIYCCGPTVYDFQHIGNFKTFICEDILVRTLRHAGYDVTHVMNITDVGHLTGDNDEGEDKMALAARREGKTSWDIARFYTEKFFEDWDILKLSRPDITCKATDHISEMIALIQKIFEQGYAYESNGNVYFDVMKFKEYGKLAGLDLEKLQAGARIEIDPDKKSPYDFALWFTRSKFGDQEMQWDSPWGRGYPGWHIECSAMSMKYLGEQFDIHCGGIDHIPVHHTNEIAQSEAATGKPWVSVWMHSEFILLNKEKMSKSKGGFLVLDDLINKGFDPLSFRMLVLSAHYRAQLNFSWEAVENAERNLDKLKKAVLRFKAESVSAESLSSTGQALMNEFDAAMYSDLNTPRALAALWKAINDPDMSAGEKLAVLYRMDEVFGFRLIEWEEESIAIPEEATELLNQRTRAREEKDYAKADEIRDKLQEIGFQIEDSPEGPKLKKV